MSEVIWHYTLDGHNPVPCDNMRAWAEWYADIDTRRAQSSVGRTRVGGVEVLTDFLGSTHGWDANDRPLLFETLVFGGPLAGRMRRYATWEEAEAGHNRMVEIVSEERVIGAMLFDVDGEATGMIRGWYCKDCKWWRHGPRGEWQCCDRIYQDGAMMWATDLGGLLTGPDFGCVQGERRERDEQSGNIEGRLGQVVLRDEAGRTVPGAA